MANTLINGSQPGETSAAEPAVATTPSWGYRLGEDGQIESKLFDLKNGEALPEGYVDSPAKCKPEDDSPKRRKKKGEDDGDGA